MTEDTFKDMIVFVDAAAVSDTTFEDLDRYALDDYLDKVYATTLDGFGAKAEQVLKNIHVLNHQGVPTLAGYLFFGKHPERHCPTCMVKAVSFFGNDLASCQYRDTKELLGNMPRLYEQCIAFLKGNLHNLQERGASFNTLGKLEIAQDVLQEVVQNALVHRDLLRPAPIRIFVFDNRVEIISPGALAGGLTEDDIRNGKTYQRNPYMATFATNALYYRGIGSGIVRILAEHPDIQLENDDRAQEFKVTIPRPAQESEPTTQMDEITTHKSTNATHKSTSTTRKEANSTQKDLNTTQKNVLAYFKKNPRATKADAADTLGGITENGIKFIIGKLQQKGLIKRVGGRKYGEWQVLI